MAEIRDDAFEYQVAEQADRLVDLKEASRGGDLKEAHYKNTLKKFGAFYEMSQYDPEKKIAFERALESAARQLEVGGNVEEIKAKKAEILSWLGEDLSLKTGDSERLGAWAEEAFREIKKLVGTYWDISIEEKIRPREHSEGGCVANFSFERLKKDGGWNPDVVFRPDGALVFRPYRPNKGFDTVFQNVGSFKEYLGKLQKSPHPDTFIREYISSDLKNERREESDKEQRAIKRRNEFLPCIEALGGKEVDGELVFFGQLFGAQKVVFKPVGGNGTVDWYKDDVYFEASEYLYETEYKGKKIFLHIPIDDYGVWIESDGQRSEWFPEDPKERAEMLEELKKEIRTTVEKEKEKETKTEEEYKKVEKMKEELEKMLEGDKKGFVSPEDLIKVSKKADSFVGGDLDVSKDITSREVIKYSQGKNVFLEIGMFGGGEVTSATVNTYERVSGTLRKQLIVEKHRNVYNWNKRENIYFPNGNGLWRGQDERFEENGTKKSISSYEFYENGVEKMYMEQYFDNKGKASGGERWSYYEDGTTRLHEKFNPEGKMFRKWEEVPFWKDSEEELQKFRIVRLTEDLENYGIREARVVGREDLSFFPREGYRIPIMNRERKQVGEIPSPEHILRITYKVPGQGEPEMYGIVYDEKLYTYDQSLREFRESKIYSIDYDEQRYYLLDKAGERVKNKRGEKEPVAWGEIETRLRERQAGVRGRIKELGGSNIKDDFSVNGSLHFKLPKYSDKEWQNDNLLYKGTVEYEKNVIPFTISAKAPYTVKFGGDRAIVDKIKDILSPEEKEERALVLSGAEGLRAQALLENTDFSAKLDEVCKRLEIKRSWLETVMWKESRVNTKLRNPIGAVGLIQFIPSTAKKLGTTTKALRSMSGVDQLDYVEKYYSSYSGNIKSVSDLYLITFYPLARYKPDSYVIGSERGDSFARQVAKQNPAISQGGNYIKKEDVIDFINK